MVKRFLMGISIIENDSANFVGQAFTNYPYYINNLLFARYFNIPEQCNIALFEQYNKYGLFPYPIEISFSYVSLTFGLGV